MGPFDMVWFSTTLFGPKFPALTVPEYDMAFILAESELTDVLCWCPKLYPTALAMKVTMILEGMAMGAGAIAPASQAPGGNYEAYVTEDEVFDVRREYEIVKRDDLVVASSLPGQLGAIIARCKKPLNVGAFLARGMSSHGCCGGVADKAEPRYGH